jgi:hypothetical protein
MLQIITTICILLGQTDAPAPKFTLDFHFAEQFDAPVNNGGEVGVTRYGFELRFDTTISDSDELKWQFEYQRDNWNFTGTKGMGVIDPWHSINTIDASATWFHKYSQKTSWFLGGLVKMSYEESASQSAVLGGTVGVIHSYSSDLTLGVGVGLIEQVLDDALIFPIFVVEWKLSDNFRLTSDISTRFYSRTGIELVWTPRKEWTLGAGISYSYDRFKLDNSGFAPNGAGEATSIPLTFRATYHASPTFDVTIFGGVVYGGALEITNQASIQIPSEDYDPAGTIGILAKIKF